MSATVEFEKKDEAAGNIIQGVIFDLDGTLLDTERLSDAATFEAFGDANTVLNDKKSQHNNLLPWEIKSKIMGMPGSTWIPMVIDYILEHWCVNVITDATPPVLGFIGQEEEGLRQLLRNRKPGDPIPPGIINEFWKRWEENLNKLCASVRECVGATQLVQALHAKQIPMAIATSSRMAAVTQKRIKHGALFECMTHIVTGDDPAVKRGKPAPDIFLEASKRLGLPPSRCLVFEDSVTGCRAAKAAGCLVVAIPDPRVESPHQTFTSDFADEVLGSLTEFDTATYGLPLL